MKPSFDELDVFSFTASEIRALTRIIENEWVNRDDPEAMAVADKLERYYRSLRKDGIQTP